MPSATLSRYECKNDRLPAVCVVCGASATDRKARTFSWLARVVVVRLPVCDWHRGYWRRRALIVSVPAVLVFLFGAAVVNYVLRPHHDPANHPAAWLCPAALIVALIWLILGAIVQMTGIRPTKITDRDVTLAGLHERFVFALREERTGDTDDERFRRLRFGDERDDFEDDARG
jgi:hypothetical protein